MGLLRNVFRPLACDFQNDNIFIDKELDFRFKPTRFHASDSCRINITVHVYYSESFKIVYYIGGKMIVHIRCQLFVCVKIAVSSQKISTSCVFIIKAKIVPWIFEVRRETVVSNATEKVGVTDVPEIFFRDRFARYI